MNLTLMKKTLKNTVLSLGIGALASNQLVQATDLSEQLILGSEFDTREVEVRNYDNSLSRFDNSRDTDNPYIGKLHRTFDSGFSPERDHSLFRKRIREGVELYRERGVTEYDNPYNMFKTISQYLSGGSMGYDGGKPAIAMFSRTKQVFLIYRVYEAKDGRSRLMCYYNSDGKIGHGGRGFAERKFHLNGYKLRRGFRITSGDNSGQAVRFGLIDPAERIFAEDEYDSHLAGRVERAGRSLEDVDARLDMDWERNPPHPDNTGYTEGQIEKKVESKSDIFSTIMDPLMFGAKLGVGAYMLKEAFKKDDDDDDDDDDFGNDYGYGMDHGMGYGSEYGMGSIMGPGNMMGMYPGMMPGMMPGMYPGMYPGMQPGYPGMQPGMPPMAPPMPPNYQQPGFPGAYPGQMPGQQYPGAQPMPGPDYTTPFPGDYPGSQPIPSYPPQTGYPQPGHPPQTGYPPVQNPVNPIGPYTPPGGDPNMYPVPGNTAPLAPTSSNNTGSGYNLGTQINHNNNTYLSTMGQ